MASSAVRRAQATAPSSATHSGKLLLRMTPALHAKLAEEAERRGVSLNQLITSRLEESLSKPSQARSAPGPAAAPAAPRASSRLTSLALGINLVVVLVAGVVAIVLLVLALADLG
jgi:HicB family